MSGWHARAGDGELLEITVPLEPHFQLSAEGVSSATRLSFVERSGKASMLLARSTGLVSSHLGFSTLLKHRPLPTFNVCAEATELILSTNKTILRRIPLDLKPGEIAQLR
jgi:hypothetical protein